MNPTEFRFAARLTLPESPRRRKQAKTIEPKPTRVLSEAEQLEEAAWKHVEESGKPVLFNGTLLMPEGMSLNEAIGFLPDEIRDDAQKAWDQKFAEIFQMLARSTRGQIREIMTEKGKLEGYEALPEYAKMALDELGVRQKMGWPEVPLEELIKQHAPKDDSAKIAATKPKAPTRLGRDEVAKNTIPADGSASEFSKLPLQKLITSYEQSSRKGQALLWNLEHHRLLLKRLDQIWEYMNEEEKQSILALLNKRIGKVEVDQIDEIVKGCDWANLVRERK